MERLLKEYYRYIIVGLFITALDFSMIAFQKEIILSRIAPNNIHCVLIAVGISYSVACSIQYLLSVKYIFVESKATENIKSFIGFFMIGVIGLIILEYLMSYFVGILAINLYVAKVFATGIIFSFNFVTKRFLIFR